MSDREHNEINVDVEHPFSGLLEQFKGDPLFYERQDDKTLEAIAKLAESGMDSLLDGLAAVGYLMANNASHAADHPEDEQLDPAVYSNAGWLVYRLVDMTQACEVAMASAQYTLQQRREAVKK